MPLHGFPADASAKRPGCVQRRHPAIEDTKQRLLHRIEAWVFLDLRMGDGVLFAAALFGRGALGQVRLRSELRGLVFGEAAGDEGAGEARIWPLDAVGVSAGAAHRVDAETMTVVVHPHGNGDVFDTGDDDQRPHDQGQHSEHRRRAAVPSEVQQLRV